MITLIQTIDAAQTKPVDDQLSLHLDRFEWCGGQLMWLDDSTACEAPGLHADGKNGRGSRRGNGSKALLE